MDSKREVELKKIAKKYKLDLLILFGSRVNNTNDKNSDWDFAYLSRKKIDYLKLYSEIGEIIKSEIDLVDLNSDLSPYFKYNILKNSKLIFESEKGLIEELYSQSVINYIDFKPYIELNREILNSKLGVE